MSDKRAEGSWLKPQELADREGISRRTIWLWSQKGIVEVRRHRSQTGVRMRLRPGERGEKGRNPE